jgi:hypothetical protein
MPMFLVTDLPVQIVTTLHGELGIIICFTCDITRASEMLYYHGYCVE